MRFASIAALLKEWQPAALVVGLPCNDDGTPHEMTALVPSLCQPPERTFQFANDTGR